MLRGKLFFYPLITTAGARVADGVAEVDSGVEVGEELVAALGGARADFGAEGGAAGVACAQVGFGQEKEVCAGGGGAGCEGGDVGEGLGCCLGGCGGCCCEADWRHFDGCMGCGLRLGGWCEVGDGNGCKW